MRPPIMPLPVFRIFDLLPAVAHGAGLRLRCFVQSLDRTSPIVDTLLSDNHKEILARQTAIICFMSLNFNVEYKSD